MPIVYRCQLELHDSLYFATREIGRLYETEPVLHNYALCYALGLVDSDHYGTQVEPEYAHRYFCGEQIPHYQPQLSPLNRRGLYVTPARALRHTAVLQTLKYGDNRYHVEMERTQKNIPSFGRTKEIAPESVFEFFILSADPLTLPRWIRLGKWASKAALSVQGSQEISPSTPERDLFFPYPLNPLDVMFTHQVMSYDVINMPPVSLIQNVRFRGPALNYDGIHIPARLQFRFQG